MDTFQAPEDPDMGVPQMPEKEPLKVVIVVDGQNFKGDPSYWLDLDDDEDVEECVKAGLLTKQQQTAIEDGDTHLTGFFNSKDEAVESAKKRGWVVTNYEPTGEFGGKAP